jgi:type IV secretion system protein VirD4
LSKLYDISTKRIEFFARQTDIERDLTPYSLTEHKVYPKKHRHSFIPNGGGGIPLSYDETRRMVYADASDSHSLILGTTGAKKSRLVAMPMIQILCAAGESMIVVDPKGELHKNSAEMLKQAGYNVLVVDLREPAHSHCWNPLAIPYRLYLDGNIDRSCALLNDIATNIIGVSKTLNDPYWELSAGSFLLGLTMLLFKYCKEFEIENDAVHFGNVNKLRRQLFTGNQYDSSNGYFSLEVSKKFSDFYQGDSIIESALIGTTNCADATKVSILSTFDQKMRIFSMQPNLMNMLAYNDIDIERLILEPTACFVIAPDEKTTYHPLVTLFIKQSYELLIDAIQRVQQNQFNESKCKRVNYIIDEFSSLPRIADFPAMITAARSRNVRFNIFIQSKHQLHERYGEEADTIQDNCTNWIFLFSRELGILRDLSDLCGKDYRTGIPAATVEDLQKLDKFSGEALVFSGRNKPYIARLPDIEKYTPNAELCSDGITADHGERVDIEFEFPHKAGKDADYDSFATEIGYTNDESKSS